MELKGSDLIAVRATLGEARAALAGRNPGAAAAEEAADPNILAVVVERLLVAMERLVEACDEAAAGGEAPTNAGVVGAAMPPGGPQFDRGRPHRGYGR